MNKPYQITEYESFVNNANEAEKTGGTYLPPNDFNALLDFVNNNNNKNESAGELFSISIKSNITYITAKNYIGLIQLKSGSLIEILPKISSTNYDNGNVIKLVTEMLSTLKDYPFKNIQSANMKNVKMSIFDVLIRMFIDKIYEIVKTGLKCGYETVESNENFFKGKIKFSENIKYNYAHKERNYVEYDEFNDNRSENKLIKSTLIYLYRNTLNYKNKNDLKTLLSAFQNVDESTNYKKDFNNIKIGRNMKNYETALQWCKVFLTGESFTSYSGSKVAFALLFPMEKLFESYVAYKLKKILNLDVYSFSAQDKSISLFDKPNHCFNLRPDIVIKNEQTNEVFVMDTKWKLLNQKQNKNYGISQADMYQMYAYQQKYKAKCVTLLYPYTDQCNQKESIEYKANDATVFVRFVDLFDINNSLKNIRNEIIYKMENYNEN